ncbi:sulfite exporter TauE/SafE family protein [Melghiribacillus thermohalophilus]|nr:sulfite exporter TauE/SafE family protein [Melghiribacillus thermohalophilus]
MSAATIILILLVGIIAGFINILAGGGSLLTLPVLIFLGLPSALSNGTNRIAIMAQNITAILSFRQSGIFHWKLGLLLALPAVIGSIFGAHAAIDLSDEAFNRILSIVMIMVLLVLVFRPHKQIRSRGVQLQLRQKVALVFIFLLIGFYGGFIQAGVGFLIISALSLFTQLNLVHINSLKVFIVGIYMFTSLAVFIINDQVHWLYGITLAIGTSIGGYLASRFAVKKGEKWVRIILIVVVIAMSIRLWYISS